MATSSRKSLGFEKILERRSPLDLSGMRSSLRLAVLALVALSAPLQAWAQDAPIPERFATTWNDTDYPGGDLTTLFNVTLPQCHATCIREEGCAGYTFDQKNGACFLKDVLGEPVPFEDALSGVVKQQSAAALERAQAAAATMDFLGRSDFDDALEQAETVAERYQAGKWSEAAWLDTAGEQEPPEATWATGAAVTV
ncbi:MAG TPA: PAN/Apple domain-containing protein, partial [Trueperaceae bacterium]|nr:PAN/Apple domain-containing protein [Trueperaceae bacterium]